MLEKEIEVDKVFICETEASRYIKYLPKMYGYNWSYIERQIVEEVEDFNFE